MTELQAHVYSSDSTRQELSNEYQHTQDLVCFQTFVHICVVDKGSLDIHRNMVVAARQIIPIVGKPLVCSHLRSDSVFNLKS